MEVDLDKLDTVRGGDEGYLLELRSPDETPLPGRMRVRSFDSRTYTELRDEQQRRRLRAAGGGKRPTVEQLEQEALELTAVLIMGWDIQFKVKGEPFAYSAANALKLVQNFPWVREQVERAAAQRANFLPGSSAS